MRTREEINEDVFITSTHSNRNERLLLELILDIRDQNEEIKRKLEYQCEKMIM